MASSLEQASASATVDPGVQAALDRIAANPVGPDGEQARATLRQETLSIVAARAG